MVKIVKFKRRVTLGVFYTLSIILCKVSIDLITDNIGPGSDLNVGLKITAMVAVLIFLVIGMWAFLAFLELFDDRHLPPDKDD